MNDQDSHILNLEGGRKAFFSLVLSSALQSGFIKLWDFEYLLEINIIKEDNINNVLFLI